MTKKKTGAGAPFGNTNAKKGLLARKSLEMAVARMHDDPDEYDNFKKRPVVEKVRPLLQIWFRAIDEALNGNIQATNTIMDRLDGKPTAHAQVDLAADITSRKVEDLSDEELLSIASIGSRRAVEEESSEGESTSFY